MPTRTTPSVPDHPSPDIAASEPFLAFSQGVPGRGILGLPTPGEVFGRALEARFSDKHLRHETDHNRPITAAEKSRDELVSPTLWMAVRLGDQDWLESFSQLTHHGRLALKNILLANASPLPYDWHKVSNPLATCLAFRPQNLLETLQRVGIDHRDLLADPTNITALSGTPQGRAWLANDRPIYKRAAPRRYFNQVFARLAASPRTESYLLVDNRAQVRKELCDGLLSVLAGPGAAGLRKDMSRAFPEGKPSDAKDRQALFRLLRAALYDRRDDVLQAMFSPDGIGSPRVVEDLAACALSLSYPFLLALESAAARSPSVRAGLLAGLKRLAARSPSAQNLLDVMAVSVSPNPDLIAALLVPEDTYDTTTRALAKNINVDGFRQSMFVAFDYAAVDLPATLDAMIRAEPSVLDWRSPLGHTMLHRAMRYAAALDAATRNEDLPPRLIRHMQCRRREAAAAKEAHGQTLDVNRLQASWHGLLPLVAKHPEQMLDSGLTSFLTPEALAEFNRAVLSEVPPSKPSIIRQGPKM